MADLSNVDTTVEHTDEHGTKFFTDDKGNKIYFRSCYNKKDHEPHRHTSYWFAKNPSTGNAYCSGNDMEPPTVGADNPYREDWGKGYTSSYTAPVKKKYAEDAENFPVSNPITVEEARKIAYDMHSKQKDKSGEEYWHHLNAVQMGVVVLGGSDEEQVAALFHDAVEDYHTTYTILKSINVTDETLVMIEAVSKRSGEQQTVYLDRVKNAGKTIPKVLADLGITKEGIDPEKTSKGTMRVKLADLLHNTRHDRVQALRDAKKGATADRLLKKYRPAMAALMLELGMIITEDEQKIATKPQGTAGGYGTTYSNNTATTIQIKNIRPGDKVQPQTLGKYKITEEFVLKSIDTIEKDGQKFALLIGEDATKHTYAIAHRTPVPTVKVKYGSGYYKPSTTTGKGTTVTTGIVHVMEGDTIEKGRMGVYDIDKPMKVTKVEHGLIHEDTGKEFSRITCDNNLYYDVNWVGTQGEFPKVRLTFKQAEKQKSTTVIKAMSTGPTGIMVGDTVAKGQTLGGIVVEQDFVVEQAKDQKSGRAAQTIITGDNGQTYYVSWEDEDGEAPSIELKHMVQPNQKSSTPLASPFSHSGKGSEAVNEMPLPQPVGYKVDEVLPGDWVREWDAPVIACKDIEGASPKSTAFLLASGEEKVQVHYSGGYVQYLYVYSPEKWREDHRLFADIPTEEWDQYFAAVSPLIEGNGSWDMDADPVDGWDEDNEHSAFLTGKQLDLDAVLAEMDGLDEKDRDLLGTVLNHPTLWGE